MILLDSHALLWALHDPDRLSARAARMIGDSRTAVYFSAASVWELEIKVAKRKLILPDEWVSAAESLGFLQIPIKGDEVRTSARLPWHHADPFDRVLIAQAMAHALRIVTRDGVFSQYDVEVIEC